MMVGIRTVVGRSQAKPADQLFRHHFTKTSRLDFPSKPKPSSQTPSHTMSDFYFKDYAPEVFRRIRKRFGIDPVDYINEVCGNSAYLEFISNSKSGEFFFFSNTEEYMIKTVSHPEANLLRAILPQYYDHIKRYPDTLITRFYGLHKVRVGLSLKKQVKNVFKRKKSVYFLIMGSVFFSKRGLPMHLQFDLKGSTAGRSASEKECKRDNPVYKDNDLLNQNIKLRLGVDLSERLNAQIKHDVELLRKLKIMDYSLLVGIHRVDPSSPLSQPNSPSGRVHHSTNTALARGRRASIKMQDCPDMLKVFTELSPTSPIALVDFEGALGQAAMSRELQDTAKRSLFAARAAQRAADSGSDFELMDSARMETCDNVWTKDFGGVSGVGPNGEHEVYYFGIIDILIAYGLKKQGETRLRRVRDRLTLWEMSAVDPFTYAERFRRFMADFIQ